MISGVVWDTAFRQLGAARVEIVDGTHAGLSTVTDDSGRFVLRGLFASPTTVRATKEGYAAATQVWKCLGGSCSDPGPVLGFHLNTLAPSVDLAGDYTVTMSADLACADLPSAARSRTYAASIRVEPGSIGSTTSYGVYLAGATFHAGGGWGQLLSGFIAAVAGNHVAMLVEDSGEPAVVEQISPSTYVAYSAIARTSTTTAASTISAPLDGWIEFCALRAPMSGAYACRVEDRADPTPSQPVTYGRCTSSNHRIVLTRRSS